jgi:hypothetical protein
MTSDPVVDTTGKADSSRSDAPNQSTAPKARFTVLASVVNRGTTPST